MVCSHGMHSTIQSLNLVLDPVTNAICHPADVCGVATVTIRYNNETGQGKVSGCVPNSFCSSTTACQLAIANLISGVSSDECKVFYFLYFTYTIFFCDCFALIFACKFTL